MDYSLARKAVSANVAGNCKTETSAVVPEVEVTEVTEVCDYAGIGCSTLGSQSQQNPNSFVALPKYALKWRRDDASSVGTHMAPA